jgi:hypothetical protein
MTPLAASGGKVERAARWLSSRGGQPFSWALLLILGIALLTVVTFAQLPNEVRLFMFVGGSVASTVGGAGIGSVLSRGSLSDTDRLRLRPAFRRTFRVYEGLSQLRYVVALRRKKLEQESKPAGHVAWAEAVRALDVVDSRLEEQLRSADDAFLEWRDIIPKEADELWADLQARRESK